MDRAEHVEDMRSIPKFDLINFHVISFSLCSANGCTSLGKLRQCALKLKFTTNCTLANSVS